MTVGTVGDCGSLAPGHVARGHSVSRAATVRQSGFQNGSMAVTPNRPISIAIVVLLFLLVYAATQHVAPGTVSRAQDPVLRQLEQHIHTSLEHKLDALNAIDEMHREQAELNK
jgi:hypothetical protein